MPETCFKEREAFQEFHVRSKNSTQLPVVLRFPGHTIPRPDNSQGIDGRLRINPDHGRGMGAHIPLCSPTLEVPLNGYVFAPINRCWKNPGIFCGLRADDNARESGKKEEKRLM